MSVAFGVVAIFLGTVLIMAVAAGAITLMLRARDRAESTPPRRPAHLDLDSLFEPPKRPPLRLIRHEAHDSGEIPRR